MKNATKNDVLYIEQENTHTHTHYLIKKYFQQNKHD